MNARRMWGVSGGPAAVVLASLLALLLAAGCDGGGRSGEEGGGQYEGGEPAPPATTASAGAGLSREECLREAAGSGDLDVEIRKPEEAPSYEVVGQAGTETGRELEVVTEARSREELTAVAEDLRFENREQDSLSMNFFNEVSGGERQDAGLALVFNTREAACRAFQYPVEEQNQLAAESNGITVISVEEGV